MTREPPFVRHPVLLSLWAVMFILAGLALSNIMWIAPVFLGVPFAAVGTLWAVYPRRQVEVLRPLWSIAYRAATVGIAVAGAAGVIATASRLAGPDARWFANGPFALVFLVAFVAAWPAITKPSPRRAALPAAILHVAWFPLVVTSLVLDRDSFHEAARWLHVVAGVSLIAILVLSAVTSVLAIVSFHGEPRIATARATAPM